MGHIRDRWKDPARKGKGRRWQVKYQVDGREKDGGSYDTKAVAQRKLVELESAVQRGQWVDPTDRTTVAEYARRWAAGRPHRPSTALRVERLITRQLEGTSLGGRRLASVRPSDVQSWVATLSAEGLAPSTVRLAVRQLASIYNAAALDHLVPTSPVTRLSLPRAEDDRVVPLIVGQVEALAERCRSGTRPWSTCRPASGCGSASCSRCATSTWTSCDGPARVEHQLERGTRARVDPKTPRSRRTIPLPTMVAERLAAHMPTFPPVPDGCLFYRRQRAALRPRRVRHPHLRQGRCTGSPRRGARRSRPGRRRTTCATTSRAFCWLPGCRSSPSRTCSGMKTGPWFCGSTGTCIPGGEDRMRKAVDGAWRASEAAPGAAPTAQGRPE